ncbi:hypothetical protein RQP46_004031 [Phenoliferia psychrophenolica]
MSDTPPPKPALKTQAEVEAQLASLQLALAESTPSEARLRLRKVCEWAIDNCKDITIDVLNAVPGGSSGVPILKVVLGIAMLRRDARDATAACDTLKERLLDIYEQSYELRQSKEEPIDGKMDVCVPAATPKWLQGMNKGATADLVNGLTAEIEVLQKNYVVPALRRLAADVECVRLDVKDVAADVKTIKDGTAPLNTPHPPPPAAPTSYGRDDDVASVVRLLTTPNSRGVTEHVVLVGVGGIGKTTLSQRIVHHPDLAQKLGAPTFIRCERVSTLPEFQQELLRLRKEALRPTETLGDAVQNELLARPRLLVLDNLFDSPSAVPTGFRSYLSTLADLPNVTFLITTRNSDISMTSSTKRIQRFNVSGLANGPAEKLFRHEFGREPSSHSLQPNDPSLQELLYLLDGIPLAVKLVASRARTESSLRDVVQLWRDGQAWGNGALVPDREDSVAVSLSISFKDESLKGTDAINLLYVLAGRPLPVPRHPTPPPVRLAIEAALRCSLVQSEVQDDSEIEKIRVLEPVRQYILWRQSQLVDRSLADSPVVRALAFHHLMTPLYMASEHGNLKEVERLLSAGDAELNARLGWAGVRGNTALGTASMLGYLEVVERLLQAGAPVDTKMDDDWTALHYASRKGHLEVFECLLQAGATVDAKAVDGWTALHLASLNGMSSHVYLS